MAGFNQQALNYRVRSGNSVVIQIGAAIVGFAQTVTHTFDFGTQSLYGIGTAMPQEIQQLRIQPTITVDAFALTNKGTGDLAEPGNIFSFLANNQFNLTIIDLDHVAVFTYVGGVASNFNENVPTNALITDTVTFLCIDVLDQTGQSILNVANAFQLPGGGANPAVTGLGIGVGTGGDFLH